MPDQDVSVPSGAEGEALPVAADDQQTAPPGAETAAAEGEQQKQEPEQKRTFTQEELDAIVQKRLLKRERQLHRQVEQQLREQMLTQARQEEPRREAFGSDEEFMKARVERLVETKAAELLRQREAERESRERLERWAEKVEAASERFPDFEAVVMNPALPINNDMAEWLSESERGSEVAYHLGKNPTLAARIAALTPVKAARELDRIERELSAPKPKTAPPPEPIAPVGSRGRSTSSALPSDSDDIETWMRKERERLARR